MKTESSMILNYLLKSRKFTDETVFSRSFSPCKLAEMPGMCRKRGDFETSVALERIFTAGNAPQKCLFPSVRPFPHGRMVTEQAVSSV